jgi:hypothetical protein
LKTSTAWAISPSSSRRSVSGTPTVESPAASACIAAHHDLHQAQHQCRREREIAQPLDLPVHLAGSRPPRTVELLGKDLKRRQRGPVVDLHRHVNVPDRRPVQLLQRHRLERRGVARHSITHILERPPLTLVHAQSGIGVDRPIGVFHILAHPGDADHLASQDEVLELVDQAAVTDRAPQFAQCIGLAAGPLFEGLPGPGELVGVEIDLYRYRHDEERHEGQHQRHPRAGGLHPHVQQEIQNETTHDSTLGALSLPIYIANK